MVAAIMRVRGMDGKENGKRCASGLVSAQGEVIAAV